MKKTSLILTMFVCCFSSIKGQTYFPPISGMEWDTVGPRQLGWCTENINDLYQFLDSTNTKGFIVLHKGKIAIEKYFNGHSADRNWYWASAGKTIIAALYGIAQHEGYFDITDPTTQYLGRGWTSMTPEQEDAITLWHHLTMTCGFENAGVLADCTDPSCLTYREDPGNRWYYHNAGYLLTHDILEASSQKSAQEWTEEYLHGPLGMDGFWLRNGQYGHLYWSTTRSMARFGLWISSNGIWDGDTILQDQNYYYDMIQTSQDQNESYGYLWWLNGKDSHRLPGLDLRIPRSLAPDAPFDLYAGIGKNGQLVQVVPSMDLVVVRMGDNPDNSAVPATFTNAMWKEILKVICTTTSTHTALLPAPKVYPNPTRGLVWIPGQNGKSYTIHASDGSIVEQGLLSGALRLDMLTDGLYFLTVDGHAPRKIFLSKK